MPLAGVDTGGTFTDLILKDENGLKVYKLLSTPSDPSQAVIQGLGQIHAEDARVVHGSTVATNAILERKGVVSALVTNAGFEDIIEIGRQERHRLYDLAYRREPQVVPPELRFGVEGRISSEGEEIESFDEKSARETARKIAASGAESVAVCLLYSFLRPEHEQAMGRVLTEECPELAVSLSHEILSEFREFERTATTVLNAYVCPRMDRYLGRLENKVRGPLRIMQSNGGSISVATARTEPVRTILSGPAGGAVGALALGRAAGRSKLITFDMGGTSTDVCLMDKALPLTTTSRISGYPIKTPMIDIHTVGAGGGSIATLDAGGALTVGPESAGADPGPVCYGKGSRITVTDANLLLGRLDPARFLGGRMGLHAGRLHKPFQDMAAKAGLDPVGLAEGIVQVADSNMERALRVISVERGHDPRDFTLLSFGGAGGLHCASLARSLGMGEVLVPKNAGVLSALGMVMADVVMDFSLTVMRDGRGLDRDGLDRLFGPLQARALQAMATEGFTDTVVLERFLDMRYQGQSFELLVELADGSDPMEDFEALHQKTYGHRNHGAAVEVVNLRLRARGPAGDLNLDYTTALIDTIPEAAMLGTRTAIFDGRETDAAVFDREALLPGNQVQGPAILTEMSTTTVIPPWAQAEVDGFANLLISVDG